MQVFPCLESDYRKTCVESAGKFITDVKFVANIKRLYCSYLAKILLPAGSTDVAVGQPIAIIVS